VSEVAMRRWHNVAGLLSTVSVAVFSLTLALHRHCSSVVSLLLNEGSQSARRRIKNPFWINVWPKNTSCN